MAGSERQRDRAEPLLGVSFRIDIDGSPSSAALEVLFPEARIAADGSERHVQYGPLTLRRALTDGEDWYRWWDSARRQDLGTTATGRTVRIVVRDRLATDRHSWTFTNAVPVAYQVSPLSASAGTPLVETIELSVDGFDAAFPSIEG
jgi:phage tail-like protein